MTISHSSMSQVELFRRRSGTPLTYSVFICSVKWNLTVKVFGRTTYSSNLSAGLNWLNVTRFIRSLDNAEKDKDFVEKEKILRVLEFQLSSVTSSPIIHGHLSGAQGDGGGRKDLGGGNPVIPLRNDGISWRQQTSPPLKSLLYPPPLNDVVVTFKVEIEGRFHAVATSNAP